MSLLSPLICLAGKDRQNETPKEKMVFEESSDIFSAIVVVKIPQEPNRDTVLTHFHGVNIPRPIPPNIFYGSSLATAAALYPERSSTSRNTVTSVTGSKKCKRSRSVQSSSQSFKPSRSKKTNGKTP
jgi:hypothetical protein